MRSLKLFLRAVLLILATPMILSFFAICFLIVGFCHVITWIFDDEYAYAHSKETLSGMWHTLWIEVYVKNFTR